MPVSNVDMNVDASPVTDESGTPASDPGEELQLAGYLDGLIAAALARKTSGGRVVGWTPEEQPPIDPPAEASGPSQDPVTSSPGQAGADSEETSPPAGGEMPPAGRASMSEELAALFRPTDQPLPPSPDDTAPPVSSTAPPVPGAPTTEPSHFLQRFLRQAARPQEIAPSGITNLDARLAGGFGPGLHLVSGPSGADRVAFLDSVVWEAVASGRPVIYYTLREGSLRAWERLIGALGSILGGPTVPLARFRAEEVGTADVEVLMHLDTALQRSVLPFVSLVDSIPAHPDTLSAFVEDVRSRAREAEERHGRLPLLVVDDLERFSFLVGSRRITRVLFRVDEVLSADHTPGLVAAGLPRSPANGLEAAPGQTMLALEPVRSVQEDVFGLVDLRLLINNQTGWTGVLPLLVDRQTGLVSDYPSGREPESVSQ